MDKLNIMDIIIQLAILTYFCINSFLAGVESEYSSKREWIPTITIILFGVLMFIYYFVSRYLKKIQRYFQLRFFYMYYIKRDINHLLNQDNIDFLKRAKERKDSKKLSHIIFCFCANKIINEFEKK